MRILKVAAFAVASYASSEGKPCKPFNPLLGETYEANFLERGIRFISEKALHFKPPRPLSPQEKKEKKRKRERNKRQENTKLQ